ncbi:MAG: methyl-accepting chemotaxis protein [Deltaproteobacteria bacterium]|nr:methyl-accepting chemotaxis protein [Deltaproteobacteria bacterium]
MNWFQNLSTRAKLILGFGVVILLLIIVIITAIRNISVMQGSQRQIVRADYSNSVDILTLENRGDEVRVALLTMMGSGSRADKELWHQVIKQSTTEFDAIFNRLLERNRDNPAILARLDELGKINSAFRETRDSQIIPLIYDGKLAEAKRLALGVQAARHDNMNRIALELGRNAVERANSNLQSSEKSARDSVTIFILLGIVAVFASALIAAFFNSIIARPLKEVSEMAGRVSSGDLTVSIPGGERNDEVGVLQRTFRSMVDRLKKQTREISEAVNVLATSSNEIAATTAELASGTEQTAIAVSETTTTVEEVKQTATVSSQKARHVSEISQNAVQVSQTGSKLVGETIDGIGRIKEQMEYIAETIVRLSEHNQAISEIIASVDDLAEQSNLLAVNASIEASKAGEHGKGFIVVAQEIKSLSEQSKQATKQVRAILNDIQKSSGAAVMATERGSKSVDSTVRQSAGTGDTISALSSSIGEASQAVMQIAASSQQQLVGMDQVALAMNNIKQATTQNATSTKQVELTVRNLQEVGQRLKTLLEHYRI